MTPPRAPRVLRIEITPRSIVYVLVAAASVWLFLQLWIIGLLLAVTLVFVGTLNPIVDWMEKRRIPRMRALALVFASLTVLALLLIGLTVPPLIEQISGIASDAPGHFARVLAVLDARSETAPLGRIIGEVGLDSLLDQLQKFLLGYSVSAMEAVGYAVMTVFLTFYLLADGKRTQGALYALVPRDYHMRLARILHNLEVIVGGYMRGQLITSAAITVFTFLLLTACGVPNALSLALFAGVVDVIPFVGGFLATAPAVVAAFPQGLPVTVVVFVGLFAYQEFENRILVPRIYGHVLRLSPAVVVLALLAGGMLLGVVGALLALPIAAGLRMILLELRVEMPGDDSVDSRAAARNLQTEAFYEQRSAGSTAPEAGQIANELALDIRNADVAIAARYASGTREATASTQEAEDARDKVALETELDASTAARRSRQ